MDHLTVEVVRSPRRRKTVSARKVGAVVRVSIPATMTRAEEKHWVAEMLRRLERLETVKEIDLERRAQRLAARYRLPHPSSIRWAENQEQRWGSCTPMDGSVRISSRVAAEPGWVLDYVIIHELAHLMEPRHSERFWSLVRRYPRAERARGWLMAKAADEPPRPL